MDPPTHTHTHTHPFITHPFIFSVPLKLHVYHMKGGEKHTHTHTFIHSTPPPLSDRFHPFNPSSLTNPLTHPDCG